MPPSSNDTQPAIQPAASKAKNDHHDPKHRYVWLVTGPAGCGKSTVAKHLSTALKVPYIEGDEFHPPANIEKMRNGVALTDSDRWDWLIHLREEALRQLGAGENGVVLTCSALKCKYRDVMRAAPNSLPGLQLWFIYLHAPEEVLLKRVATRKGHYMAANMVHGQFDILEPPTMDEKDVISIDVTGSVEEIKKEGLSKVFEKMRETE